MNKPSDPPRNLRIAYIMNENVDRETGVLKKVAMQMRCWKKNGHEVKLFVAAENKERWVGLGDLDVDVTLIQKFSNKMDINLLYTKIHPWVPDILYFRFCWSYPFINKIISIYPSIMEINSNDYFELKTYLLKRREYLKFMLYAMSRDRLYRNMKGFVFLSSELKDLFSKYNKPGIVISNGIDLTQLISSPVPNGHAPTLFFIGTPGQTWHGVDKMCEMAQYFPAWKFEMVGFNSDDISTTPPKNMQFHGHLTNEDYACIVSKSDLAIGTLALYRKNMNEASPLKVREYLAYGLPVIIGYMDTDFPDGAPFILQLPNTPANVVENLNAIEKFVLNWMGRRVERKDIAHLDVDDKEKERLKFFKNILDQR
jgi:hypothetical protein